ncbi:MAG: DUF808 domain-containing protein [Silicimonas sp.]|jgi:hypothetical protein|nr:DUF808 domain-containing protein [Silicimonas sp.]
MSGLLALLDDVAAIARLTAAQVDDIAAQAAKVGGKISATVLDDAAKAGAKAAGVVIDDAAVTPKYVTGLPATRELPIIWKIARASFFNKLVILLPAALLLDTFLPWLVTPLLMLGGCYLSFEGAEKIWHWLHPHPESHAQEAEQLDAAHLEETRVKGAIKTDFILSAEIMTISLAAIETDDRLAQGVVLAIVAVGITSLVYGAVALLVKMDDAGLKLSQIGRLSATRKFGRWLVKAMPGLMRIIATVGTAAMLWVGGNIIVHGLEVLGWHLPYETIKGIAKSVGGEAGFLNWAVTAALDGIIGLVLGLLLIPIVTRAVVPVLSVFFPEKASAKH